MELGSPALQADSLPAELPGKPCWGRLSKLYPTWVRPWGLLTSGPREDSLVFIICPLSSLLLSPILSPVLFTLCSMFHVCYLLICLYEICTFTCVSCLCQSHWHRSHYVFLFSPPTAFNFYPCSYVYEVSCCATNYHKFWGWSRNSNFPPIICSPKEWWATFFLKSHHEVTCTLPSTLSVLPWMLQAQGTGFPPTAGGSSEVAPSPLKLPDDDTAQHIPWLEPHDTPAEDPARSRPDSGPTEITR